MNISGWKCAQEFELVRNGRGVIIHHQSVAMACWIHQSLIKDTNPLLGEPVQRLLVPLLVSTLEISAQLTDDEGRSETALTIARVHEMLPPYVRKIAREGGIVKIRKVEARCSRSGPAHMGSVDEPIWLAESNGRCPCTN